MTKIYINFNEENDEFSIINNHYLATLTIKNIGLGIAKNIIFTDFNYEFTEINDIDSTDVSQKLSYKINMEYLYIMPYLTNNASEKIPIIFSTINENVNSNLKLINPIKSCTLIGNFKINYSDNYNNWFSQKINFSFYLENCLCSEI